MDAVGAFRTLTRGSQRALIIGVVLLALAVTGKSVFLGLIGLAVLARPAWTLYSATRAPDTREPWTWPADFRSQAEGLARTLDPTPRRLLPPDERASTIAQVATTREGVSRLIADKPPAWPWALFTSVLVQRRNAVQARLRRCASGYQPRPGIPPVSGLGYCQTVQGAMKGIVDLAGQTEQFMLSPAFTGAFGEPGDESGAEADADAVVAAANRVMDYHEAFLAQAEACLQTPVQTEVVAFVQDTGALALCPLLGYDQFIRTMCARIGEAQDLLPFTKGGVVALDDVNLTVTAPDGLTERVVAHIKRFNV